MDTTIKTMKRKVYQLSKGFVDEELPITFRELNLDGYTQSDLKASSIIKDIVKLGKDNGLYDSSIFFIKELMDFRFYIAEVPDNSHDWESAPKIVGVAIVEDVADHIYNIEDVGEVKSSHIDFLVVDEKYRGIGIGQSLIDFVFNSLDSDIIATSLNVNDDNYNARNLYEKMGFRYSEAPSEFIDSRVMRRINNPDFQIISNIGSKGIEYVYMNCNRSDIIDFLDNIEENSKLVNSNKIEIKSLKEKYPSAIELVKEWVLGFEKFKREQPTKTYADYMCAIYGKPILMDKNRVSYQKPVNVGLLKNTNVYKKCDKQASGLGMKVMYVVSHKVRNDIIGEKYANKSELEVSGNRISLFSKSLGFDKV